MPKYQVARRVEVGQATHYRNFPSRDALATEILDEHVERIAGARRDGRPRRLSRRSAVAHRALTLILGGIEPT